jgi:hypothetical protein
MSFLNHALGLADKGFHVFPLIPGSKLPLIEDFVNQATTDKNKIKKWWLDPVMELEQPYNIGISTTKWGTDGALVVVDVDNKGKKKGDSVLFELEMQGKELDRTFTQLTPTGGRHLCFLNKEPVKQGVNVLGDGLDIRSKGGYIVGAGSIIDGKEYTIEVDSSFSPAPDWLVQTCGKAPEKKKNDKAKIDHINKDSAVGRAIHYLKNEAPESIKGQGGDQTAYRVAARVKDFGVDESSCLELMLDHWFNGSGWMPEKLKAKIEHAYRYGQEAVGAAAPEAQFDVVPEEKPAEEVKALEESYLHKMNREYALIYMEGSHFILHETIDEKGRLKRVFLTEQTFKRRFSPFILQDNKTTHAEEWLDWKNRREYKGVCFAPEREARHGYYNLWRGFTCEPTAYADGTPEQRKGFDMFIAHARENICRGEEDLFKWLMGYFAHMVQRPWERPLTTVVFRGGKGVGKNALVDRVGNLLGSGHYLVAHDGRYLTSNFNAHFDSCLCLVLDEAFWSGDKSAEGKLKGITTAPEIMIERKGKEPYMVDNLVRLIVIGNEKWLVPASADERRYAVYDVGDGKKQDRKFFTEMRVLLDNEGGNKILLHYLRSYDLSKVDVNAAPTTQALLEQKMSSLEPFQQWWFDCLCSGHISSSDFGSEWVTDIDKERFRMAFFRYCKDRQIRSRIPDNQSLGKLLKSVVPTADTTKKRREGTETVHIYRLPSLEIARQEWENLMGQAVTWE